MTRPDPLANDELPAFLWLDEDDGPDSLPAVRPRRAEPTEASDRHTPGEAGLWIFILGDMTLFGVILLVFMWERRSETGIFTSSAMQLIQPLGAVNTLVLLLSSYLVVGAVTAHRHGRLPMAKRLVSGAMGCALTFTALKAVEYTVEVSEGHTPGTGSFFTFYFVLTGLHLVHVVVGLGLLSAWMTTLHRSRPWSTSSRFVEGIATYWHMVDLLWIAIFTLVYLVGAE